MMSTVTQTMKGDGDLPSPTARVWDPLVRIFHWSLLGLFVFSYFTGDEWETAHVYSGYAIIGLLAFRIVWGVIGSRHARFSDFIYRPRTVVGFVGDTLRMRAKRYVGHNPAGGMMVLALIAVIGTIAATGYMMTTDTFWGVEWVDDAHEMAVNVALGLIVLHVLGVVLASVEHRENLVRAMITGRKRAD